MNHINIDPERILSDIDRNIFGGYIEIGERDSRFKYLDPGDSPDPGKNGLRTDVKAAIKRMNLSNVRFPGGNFASSYHWLDGVGPRQERPARYSTARRCIVENQYGTNEFMRFCRATDIEPYLCVNCGDGDMREAADWVEYCNGTGETALVKLRQEHGFTAPHKVKYWGIGNEVDSPSQIGYKTSQEFARSYTEFSKVMKRVDPTIKLVASAVCSWEDFPLGNPQFLYRKTEWVERTQLMLEQAGDRIDYMAIHRYAEGFDGDPYETYMAFGADFDERITAYEGIIRAVSLERGIKHAVAIAVDEWGAAHRPKVTRDLTVNIARDEWGIMRLPESRADVRSHGERMFNNLEDSLVTAQYLNTFIRHAYSVRMANLTPMPTFLGRNFSNPDSAVPMPTIFFPFELYSRTCGLLALDVFWSSETFSGKYIDRMYSGIRTLDVAATLDKMHKQLVIYVVNQSKDKAMETTISLASGEFTGNVLASIINGPDIKSENTEEKPNQVGVRGIVVKAKGKSLTYTFEPHSVTALVCTII